MDLIRLCVAFIGLVTWAPSAAAESPSALTCSATVLPDGSTSYRLSHPPTAPQCETCWEDQNKTVIARDSNYDENLINNLTNQSITLKLCHADLHYTRECSGVHEEVHCRVNCSDLLLKDTQTVNSTLTCLFGNWCPDQNIFIPCVIGIFILAVVVVLLIYKIICRRPAVVIPHYTVADQDIKIDIVQQM